MNVDKEFRRYSRRNWGETVMVRPALPPATGCGVSFSTFCRSSPFGIRAVLEKRIFRCHMFHCSTFRAAYKAAQFFLNYILCGSEQLRKHLLTLAAQKDIFLFFVPVQRLKEMFIFDFCKIVFLLCPIVS